MISVQNGITVTDNHVIIEGRKYPLPCKPTNTIMINGKVYINGYEFKNGKWKKTIKAIFHKYF